MAAVNNIDKTAPITIDDAPKGWVNKDITVSFLAADMGSGVAATYYEIDGSTPQTGNTVTISSEGIHTLVYWSVDHAGNAEEKKSLSLHLDKTAPSIQLILDKTTPWPANNKPVTVTATVYSSDNLSQIDSIVLTSITPSVPDDGTGQIIGEAQYGTLDTSFTLLAKKASGKTDLVYMVKYTAADKAGNKTDAIASVTVPHDQSGK
ncbi:OmpL47-type beta-barrel domain-containing protein [Paenibacillus sp. V4I9]|uniref:OmpL47-type beta-barrel domain-containing protein n=1 Tax=Paenibacillus sp. V4I9 TaxID=3042308 RepID=UPI003593441C